MAAALVLLGAHGCTGHPPVDDPDTRIGGPAETFKLGGDEVSVATARPGRPLSPPTYLPAWAPPYPAARLRSKTLQRRQGRVIGRGTEYETFDAYERVIAFYVRHLAGSRGAAQLSRGDVATFDGTPEYRSLLNIQRVHVLNGAPRVSIVIAQATPR